SEAINSRSRTDQRSYGAGVQLTLSDPVLGHENQFVLGAGADGGDTAFRQAQQAASFSADRGTPGVGEFAATTDVATTNRYLGLYLSDSLHLSRRTTLTVSGRYNHAAVTIADRTGTQAGLNGDHRFARFNPAVG